MRPLQEYTLDALRQLVGVSEITQKTMLEDKSIGSFSPHQFANDFCTIRFKGPRQCGHTHALIKLSKERFFKWTLLVTHNHGMADHTRRLITQIIGHRNRIHVIGGYSNWDRSKFVVDSVDVIMVDCASYFRD